MSGSEQAKAKEDAAAIMRQKQAAGRTFATLGGSQHNMLTHEKSGSQEVSGRREEMSNRLTRRDLIHFGGVLGSGNLQRH